jgi:protein tyrosine phosphatase
LIISRIFYIITLDFYFHFFSQIKCHRYWPSELNKPEYHGDMVVTMVSEQMEPVPDRNGQPNTNPDEVIIVRQLLLEKRGSKQQRTLSHIQYKGWMDFGVPDDPLGTLRLIELAGNTQTSFEHHAIQNNELPVGPMFVHCSAGCGRTGAFCTIDTLMTRLTIQDECMTEAEREGQLDILRETVEKFREQRVSMVQTLRQLAFCYEATLWWTLSF